MSRFGAEIRRGVMSTDQFTQVANALFRDRRLSFKAKGIFGYISTHRNGWQVTVADLARLGPDGREAVRTGLQELERHRYLIRERLRRADGTLGEIIYCITDRPATLDLAWDKASTQATSPPAGHGRRAGIRRGGMAADQFTQIANALFRDGTLSFKAKGLFGLLSTHREGWRMSVADIARAGRDGDSAVRSGLKELQSHGFLVRERERGPDGTLGAAAYVITDLPALRASRSQPESGYPRVDDPTLADRPLKNTNRKKTTQQKTRPLPPAARPARSRHQAPPLRTVPAATDLTPGVRLLLQIGAQRPELLLTGRALADQGTAVSAMLNAGWTREQLNHVISARPLPSPIRTTVGATIAARLRAAQAYPPSATVTEHHATPAGHPVEKHPTTSSAAARTVSEALAYRALVECAGCGVPGTAPGENLCPACLNWPPCRTCPGPTPRRAHPHSDGRCTTCASTSTTHPEASPLTGR
ncbi:hypothetical protein [Streptomyces dubilierae]|uniref:Helix-turn-helix domain-containing protein n=1 Tax=Streptomyces dubilierae TaxID=3075533 RepID=A0ABU2PJJ1_9ACTN|nr:hypothetical protein [Streptomyces sp. DSM 41921]MDT0392335.1 hypothetical protein [Streptomyces sp. DSM 41921]